jgi:penicillin amidase
VARLFNRGPVNLPGGSAIVDANGWNAADAVPDNQPNGTRSRAYDVDWAPSMRMVVDLSNLDASHWVNQTGNSGHAFAASYDDQTQAWAKNELFEWPFSQKAVKAAGGDELTLQPDKGSANP